jgi:peptidoglycan/LPS O-acetylase OafA/YrhL
MGVAALTVVSYHVWGQYSDFPAVGLGALAFQAVHALSNGIGAVLVFLVLSGFVLARSLEANGEPLRFFRNRIYRLFPAGIATIVLMVWLHGQWGIYVAYEGDFSPLNVLLNMLMVRTDINAVMWSLKVECLATPLILVCAWLMRRNGAGWLWGMIVLLFGLSFVGQYRDALSDATNLAPLYAFVVGVLAYHYGKRVADMRPAFAIAVAALSVVTFCYCGMRN